MAFAYHYHKYMDITYKEGHKKIRFLQLFSEFGTIYFLHISSYDSTHKIEKK
jgi:hypothetical protein